MALPVAIEMEAVAHGRKLSLAIGHKPIALKEKRL
jgi:hypothetical protein